MKLHSGIILVSVCITLVVVARCDSTRASRGQLQEEEEEEGVEYGASRRNLKALSDDGYDRIDLCKVLPRARHCPVNESDMPGKSFQG